MLPSSPAWLSAATSTLAYGVRKAGSPAVDVPQLRQPLAGRRARLLGGPAGAGRLAACAWYGCVITDTSESSAGSMSQVSWSSWAQAAPASSSVERRPPEATEPASSDVASVFGHAPCCGVSMSGQTHATCSPLGWAGGVAARPERQERAGGRRVRAARGRRPAPGGEDAELVVEVAGRERHGPGTVAPFGTVAGHLVRLPRLLERESRGAGGGAVGEFRHLRRVLEPLGARRGLHGDARQGRPGVVGERPGHRDRGVRRAFVGVIPVMEMASVCVSAAIRVRTAVEFHWRKPARPGPPRAAGRTPRGGAASATRTQGTNDGAHGLHVMAVRCKGLG